MGEALFLSLEESLRKNLERDKKETRMWPKNNKKQKERARA
jgi:hypothetical protein